MMKPPLAKILFGIVGIMLLVGAVFAFLAFNTPSIGQVFTNVPGDGIMTFWYPNENQYSVKNPAGSFEIKDYVLDGRSVYLFYVMETANEGLPQVTVLSSDAGPYEPPSKPDAQTTPAPTPTADLKQATAIPVQSIQIIDTFDRIQVGLIKVEVADQPNQLVTFQITPPGDPQTTWQLTPFHQINSLATNSSTMYGASLQTYQGYLPWYTDVIVDMPVTGGEGIIGVVKIYRTGATTPPLSLQLDRQGNLTPFNQTNCPTILPPYPTNPPRQDGGPVTATVAVPAPCNKS